MRIPVAFSLAATLLTPLLGLQQLRTTLTVTRCFQTPTSSGSGTLTGCGPEHLGLTNLISGAALQLALPLVFITALSGGAWVMARRGDALSHAAYTAAYTITVLPVTLLIGPVYVVPVLLLVAGVLLFSRATARTVVRELATGTVLVFGAFAATLAAIAVWRARLGGPHGDAASVWLYLGIATALGIAAGCMAAVERSEPRALVRWVVVAQVGFAIGALATAIVSLPALYPHGEYVNLGMAAVFSQVASTALVVVPIAGVLALRFLGRLSWLAATVATPVIGALFMYSALATLVLAWAATSPFVGPPLPLLPNTSATD
jgi:hypothetical protein